MPIAPAIRLVLMAAESSCAPTTLERSSSSSSFSPPIRMGGSQRFRLFKGAHTGNYRRTVCNFRLYCRRAYHGTVINDVNNVPCRSRLLGGFCKFDFSFFPSASAELPPPGCPGCSSGSRPVHPPHPCLPEPHFLGILEEREPGLPSSSKTALASDTPGFQY